MAFILGSNGLQAQVSGLWDANGVTGTSGYVNKGNGVIELIDAVLNGCQGGAVHETSVTYDPSTNFSKCYQVFFGCPAPGNDNIGGPDIKGDGLAFCFWKNSATFNENNGVACGGGIGYMGAASDGKMITIEFDTYDNQGTGNFDGSYGGGIFGNHDEVCIHKDQDASDAGLLSSSSVDAGNLEDGLEHAVCISYNATTHILSVTIDGVSKLSYDMGASNNLATYFGGASLNQSWTSGKNGASNPATVSDGVTSATITAQLGGVSLCPSYVVITSPGDQTNYTACSPPTIPLTAASNPPAGNTISSIDILVDGVNVGNKSSAPYTVNWASTYGSHALTATSHYSGGTTSSTTTTTSINVGGLDLTTVAPVIDGTQESTWNAYGRYNLTQGFNSAPSLAGYFKVMYDATNLYLLVNVTDNTPNNPFAADASNFWKNDGAEVFIDIGNTKTTSYGANQFQYALNWNKGSVLEFKHSATGGVTTGQTSKAGSLGYITEMKFPWATLGVGAPAAGTYLGFDVMLDDNTTGAGRTNQLSWKDGTFNQYNVPSLFGTLQASSCSTPLPIELISFYGERKKNAVVLNWLTGSELNNDKFIIERSTNGIDWDIAGVKMGAGNSSETIQYTFLDDFVFDGIVYYRIKQIDFDGRFSYSDEIAIASEKLHFNIEPNPFEDVLTIKSDTKGELNLRIYDVLGRLLFQHNQDNNNAGILLKPMLPSGAYVLLVQTKTTVEKFRIIKK